MSVVIGIDSGKRGAIAILRRHLGIVQGLVPMPLVGKEYDEQEMCRVLIAYCDTYRAFDVFIEQTSPRPPNSMQSAVVQKAGECLWRGMCVAVGAPYTLVSAQRWQREMFKGVTPLFKLTRTRAGCMGMRTKRTKDTKAMSILAAQRLFPDVSLLRTNKCKKPDHGMADALLIAEYGRRQLGLDGQKEKNDE